MSETYLHRCIGPEASTDGASVFVWECRCGDSPRFYSAETARDGWGDSCPAAMAERIAELEATIANERGEGEPPEPGWVWTGEAWVHGRTDSDPWLWVGRAADGSFAEPWTWSITLPCPCPLHDGGHESKPVPAQTARAAMRAATQALRSPHAD